MEELICAKTKEYIRKAYFESKLAKLINEIQAEGKLKEKDFQELYSFLNELKVEDEQSSKSLLDNFIQRSGMKSTDIEPPTTDKLFDELNGKEKEKFEAWKTDCDKAVKEGKIMMHRVRHERLKHIEITKDKWVDYALELAGLSTWFSQDLVYKEQLYRRRLTDIIDNFHCSRAEAEERAKITPEYREYKLAKNFREDINEFILLCKKRAGVFDE